jgi:transmembrane 9 superfamily member 2/4
MFVAFGLEDVIELLRQSSAATPFYKAVGYCLLWLLLDVPLCFLGAYAGSQQDLTLVPTVDTSEKKIPPQPWYQNAVLQVGFYGLLSFLSFAVQIKNMMDSVWRNNMLYGMFAILLANTIFHVVILAIFSVV